VKIVKHPLKSLLKPAPESTRKLKPFWILTNQEMMGWQWHQLDYMQIICTSLQTDNHASALPFKFFTGRMLLFSPRPTVSKHWRHMKKENY